MIGQFSLAVAPSMQLHAIDYVLLVLYFVFVIAIGAFLKRNMKSSEDFFLSGRSIPAWIAGLAFLSANLGAQEVIGMAASGAKYGIATSHFYWIGAVPAMVFVGVFMMPFYYGSKARSVPEYLKLRYDEKTRGFNAISFAAMTIFSSGISMYAMAKLLNLLLGWNFDVSLWISAAIVLAYIFLGGLTSAIYNEVMQFFLIIFGFAPLVFLGLKNVGGWPGLKEKLIAVATQGQQTLGHAQNYEPNAWTSAWGALGSSANNPMGVEWFGMAMGLGFVLSFGYWCTDFLVVQRAMVAKDEASARMVPLIASVPKMFFPLLVIVPGMIAVALTADTLTANNLTAQGLTQDALAASGGFSIPLKEVVNGVAVWDYDMVIPSMLARYFPTGLLGLGLTALMASFMSGMAGNVTAFNTVWTYDIYQSYIAKGKSDQHYLWMGRAATVFGILVSLAAAYMANSFNNIMDMLQLVFAFVNAPLFATFLLGMFWRRTTGHGAFIGLIAGTLAATIHHGLTLPINAAAGVKGGWLIAGALHSYSSEMAQNFWTAIWSWSTCFVVTMLISVLTKRTKSDEDLKGLVFSLTPRSSDGHLAWYKRPVVLGAVILACALVLNIIFA